MSVEACAGCSHLPVALPNSRRLCLTCWRHEAGPLNTHPEGRRAIWTLGRELGIPPHSEVNSVTLVRLDELEGVRLGDRWRDCQIELYGTMGAPVDPATGPSPSSPKTTYLSVHGGVLQVWQELVFWRGLMLYGEIRWHPDRGKGITIRGIENAAGLSDLRLIWQALHWWDAQRPTGRPAGTGALSEMSAEEFCRLYTGWKAEQAKKWPRKHFGQLDMANELGVARSVLTAYLSDKDLPWPPCE